MRFDRTTLDNGLELIGEHHAHAESIAVGFFVRTGARDESRDIMGVSHFLEHMMFKGTDRRTAEDMNREFDEMGAQYNAFTSEENTVYFGAVLPEFQSRVIDLLADMMRPSLRDEDFEMERKVILEEIALYKDRPQFRLFDLARQRYFGDHPLGNQVLGTEQTIKALSRDKMHEYFSCRYAPNNLCLVIVGNYDWESCCRDIERLCHNWSPAQVGRKPLPVSPRRHEEVVQDDKLQMAHTAFIGPGFSAQDDERYAASLLSEAVGGAKGSRLFWALVHPGMAETAQMYHDAEDGAGEFIVYLSSDPTRAERAVDTARQLLQQARSDGISEDELSRAKRKIASGMVVSGETPFGRLVPVGFDWIYRQQVLPLGDHVDRILTVTLEEVNTILAERDFDVWTTVTLSPVG